MSSGLASTVSASYAGAKLYYSATSCSAASFISAYTAGLKGLLLEQVDLKTHTTKSGKDFYTINPKGNLPTLVLGDGTMFNEGAAILQLLADQMPSAQLAPPNGTVERYRLQNALNHIGTEVHQRFNPLFELKPADAAYEFSQQRVTHKLHWLEKEIQGKFYVGQRFSVADAYLYIVLSWLPYVHMSLDGFPNVKKYFEGIKALPNVQEAEKLMANNPEKL